MAYTTANLITFCQQNGFPATTGAAETELLRFINAMIQRLASAREWPSYRKPYYLALTAPYTTGTVHLTNGSATVTATGTTFASGMVGQEFYTSEDSARVYQVASLTGTTEIELESVYLGGNRASTASGAPVEDSGESTVTAAAAMFVAGDVGKELTFKATGNSYTIASYTSATIVVVTGDASGEASADPIYVELEYSIRYVGINLPSDFDHSSGALWLETGGELSYELITMSEWQRLRLFSRGTASLPTDVAFSAEGPSQKATHRIFVHPAPSAAALLRGTYQATPVTATSSVAPDWPERYLYLLHKMLRMEISTQDSKAGRAGEALELEALIEQAYQRDVQQSGPVTIRPRGGIGAIDNARQILAGITVSSG